MQKGLLLAVEGGEGTGKDTVLAHIKKEYTEREDVVFVREPGGTEVGEMLREILLSARSSGMTVEAELCCVFAARAQLLHEVVLPALEAGKVVVSNRFALSSAVYQLARKEREDLRPLYEQLYASVVGELPVHYVLLDCPPEVGLARARGRKGEVSRIDMEDVSIHERVRTAYLKEVQRYPHVVVDAAQEKAVVCDEVSVYIAQLLQH